MGGVDGSLAECSQSLLSKSEEMVRFRKLQRNIAVAVDEISLCLPMLEKYAKLQKHLDEKRFPSLPSSLGFFIAYSLTCVVLCVDVDSYYSALKTLEQLEHTYLPQVSKYRFAQKLMEDVNDTRERIKESSFSLLTDFLEHLRGHNSSKVGQLALKHVSEKRNASLSLASYVHGHGVVLLSCFQSPHRRQMENCSSERRTVFSCQLFPHNSRRQRNTTWTVGRARSVAKSGLEEATSCSWHR